MYYLVPAVFNNEVRAKQEKKRLGKLYCDCYVKRLQGNRNEYWTVVLYEAEDFKEIREEEYSNILRGVYCAIIKTTEISGKEIVQERG